MCESGLCSCSRYCCWRSSSLSARSRASLWSRLPIQYLTHQRLTLNVVKLLIRSRMVVVGGGSDIVAAPTPFKGHWPPVALTEHEIASEIVIAEHIVLYQPAVAAAARRPSAAALGHFMVCWFYGGQRPLNSVGAATASEPLPTAIIQERMCEAWDWLGRTEQWLHELARAGGEGRRAPAGVSRTRAEPIMAGPRMRAHIVPSTINLNFPICAFKPLELLIISRPSASRRYDLREDNPADIKLQTDSGHSYIGRCRPEI
ncbi:hypothetical protein GGX14DRAFT_408319 [Mycena pura]|uniref:Uncharacterized protein n=1 Tax=Mycena pura TaxID=153505 RepID=A0AAD6ULA3_9AGAR|nr:hypothetical protein GGX14DRAFT_408319 [Mycena pura]